MQISSDLIGELKNLRWFSDCGAPLRAGVAMPVHQLEDWEAVATSCESAEWIEMTETAQGNLTEHLANHHPDKYHGIWNAIVRKIRPEVEATAGIEAEKIASLHHLPKGFVDAIKWDVLHAVMETVYAETLPPVFFRNLMEIYRLGHCPCGVDSESQAVLFF